MAVALVSTTLACKPKEVVEPEKEWVPDETLEPEQATADPAPGLTEEQKLDKAKALYRCLHLPEKGAVASHDEPCGCGPAKFGERLERK